MSYIDDYPTHFNFTKRVRSRVNAIQRKYPWMTFANTYVQHPPGYNRYYERVSVDFWGGGGDSAETYSGYRGKRLPKELGDAIFEKLFWADHGPEIDWIIWSGRMWWSPKTGGPGWTDAPSGPADSDPGHYRHIHCTFIRGT